MSISCEGTHFQGLGFTGLGFSRFRILLVEGGSTSLIVSMSLKITMTVCGNHGCSLRLTGNMGNNKCSYDYIHYAKYLLPSLTP